MSSSGTVRLVVQADPYKELPIKTAKAAGNCEEIHLGGRSIHELGDAFKYFVSLECLWLNDNNLTDISGLDGNFRIKILYLNGNKMAELQPEQFEHFIALHTLSLGSNQLNDLTGTCYVLKHLRNLRNLDLNDNPISKEDNYRLRVIGELPTLETFDKKKVTEDERRAAKVLLKKLSKLQNFKLKTTDTSVKIPLTPQEIADNMKMKEIKVLVKNQVEAFRINLDSSFVNLDRKKTGYLDNAKFWQIMRQYGITGILNSDEVRVVNTKYSKMVRMEDIEEDVSRELMDYRQFCFDIMPAELIKLVPAKYKMEVVPEISVSTVDLGKYVDKVQKRRAEEEILYKKQTMLAASHSSGGGTVFDMSKKKTVDANGLDPWLNGELRKILKVNQKDNQMSKEHVLAVVKHMESFGKTLNVNVKMLTEKLQLDNEGDPTVDAMVVGEMLGCLISPTGARSKIFLKWVDMHDADASKIESKLFNKSLNMYDTLMCASDKDDTSAMRTSILSTGISATRLASKKKNTATTKDKSVRPMEILRDAPKRADVVILPNLLPYDTMKNTINTQDLSMPATMDALPRQGQTSNQTIKATTSGDHRSPFFVPEIPPDQMFQRSLMLQAKMKSSGTIPNASTDYQRGWNESTGSIILDRSG